MECGGGMYGRKRRGAAGSMRAEGQGPRGREGAERGGAAAARRGGPQGGAAAADLQRGQNLFLRWPRPPVKPGVQVIISPFSCAPQHAPGGIGWATYS